MTRNMTATSTTDRLLPLLGAALFVGMMSVGYYYNLTFVQLGLVDLGERRLGLPAAAVAGRMALLALLTCLVALVVGRLLLGRPPGLLRKLRLLSGVLLLQSVLTLTATRIHTPDQLTLWLVFCSLALGVGMPVTFGLSVDLVPVRWRGMAAALITGLAYLAANLVPRAWTLEEFAVPLRWLLPGGVLLIAALAFLPLPPLRRLAAQHRDAAFATGRYADGGRRRLALLILLMFAVFFVDSLGFLRLLDTPRFMTGAWQAAELDPRLLIGLVHLAAALVGGILYDALEVEDLFYWIFGIFVLTHLLYTFSVRASTSNAPLVMPILYAVAVSLYTVVNFALWADLSTPRTISWYAALGVALSGWTATFLSTALALRWQTAGVSLLDHLNRVDALAMLCFLGLILLALRPRTAPSPEVEVS